MEQYIKNDENSITAIESSIVELNQRKQGSLIELEKIKLGTMSFESSEQLNQILIDINSEINNVSKIFRTLEDNLLCFKCGGLFQYPYTIRRCGHTYCAKCLKIDPESKKEINRNSF